MNIHAAVPVQLEHGFATPDWSQYDRHKALRARLEKDREDEARQFSGRMATDKLDDDAFYAWADNGGADTLFSAFKDDSDRVFLQIIIRAHQHEGLRELTGPIIERLKASAYEYKKEELSWLVN